MAIREIERLDIATDADFEGMYLCVFRVGQHQTKLCWAACTAMLMDYYGRLNGETLCGVVAKMTDRDSPEECCFDSPGDEWHVRGECNGTMKSDAIAPKWLEKYHLPATPVSRPLTICELYNEIEVNKRPVMIMKDIIDDVEHVVVVYGWQKVSDSHWNFGVHDPMGASTWIDYRYLQATWLATWWQMPGRDSRGDCR